MRAGFEHYLRPSDAEYKEIWMNGLFVFDTNVLLDLYRYTKKSRDELLGCLKKLAPQLWLPHQVAEEFHRNRAEVIASYESDLQKIESRLQEASKDIREKVNRKNPSISASLVEMASKGIADLATALREKLNKELVTLDNDVIFPVLESVYSGKVGPAYTDAHLEDLFKKGKERFDKKVPPGYLDKPPTKPEPRCYGDYVWWCQLLDHNTTEKMPIVVVTSESDEDWWHIASGKTIGPRYELLADMQKRAGQRLLMYSPNNFLKYYQEFTKAPIDASVLKEVEAVTLDREAQRRAALERLKQNRREEALAKEKEREARHKATIARLKQKLRDRKQGRQQGPQEQAQNPAEADQPR